MGCGPAVTVGIFFHLFQIRHQEHRGRLAAPAHRWRETKPVVRVSAVLIDPRGKPFDVTRSGSDPVFETSSGCPACSTDPEVAAAMRSHRQQDSAE